MKTRPTPTNPLGPTRAGYAWEQAARLAGPHLDFGCFRGDFLDALSRATGLGGPAAPPGFSIPASRRLVGIDANREAIEAGRKLHPHLELVHAPNPLPLPFEDGAFASVTILDVLEHVPDQTATLDELARVLRDDGVLVVTVPRQYPLSFMDLGNLKFRFPRLHRLFYTLRHSREAYERRYAANPDGLIGDISAEKAWHEHFSEGHLAELLRRSGLEVVDFDGSAFFTRAFRPLGMLLKPLPPARRIAGRLAALDARWFASMNLFCTARKRPT